MSTLDRFVRAQEGHYGQALAELQAGRKTSHWIWFVLPQLRGLGRSSMANEYGLAGRAEAEAYLAHPLLGERLREHPAEHWLALLEGADVPAGPVNELPEVFDNPQVRHRGLLVQTEHPQAGALPLLASPLRLSETPVTDYSAPPTLGQHTREVLRERLGFTDTDLDALAARGVI